MGGGTYRILEQGPAQGREPVDAVVQHGFACAGRPGAYYLAYLGIHQPRPLSLALAEGGRFAAEVIDTWEMTIAPMPRPWRVNDR